MISSIILACIRYWCFTSNCGSSSGLCGRGGLLGRSCKSSYRGAGGGALRWEPLPCVGADDFDGSRLVTFRLCLLKKKNLLELKWSYKTFTALL